MPQQDRRAHERFPVHINVTLHFGPDEHARAVSRDFSAGGTYVECGPALVGTLKVRDKVRLTVHFGDESDTLGAEIARVTPNGVGLRFDRVLAAGIAA